MQDVCFEIVDDVVVDANDVLKGDDHVDVWC